MTSGQPDVASTASGGGINGITPRPGAMSDLLPAMNPESSAGRYRKGGFHGTQNRLLVDVSGGWQ